MISFSTKRIFSNLQMRLDFTNFVITGPTTITTSIGLSLGGQIMSTGAGLAMTQKTTCATDTFSVSNAPSVPVLCGTLTGDHGKNISISSILSNYKYLIPLFQFTLMLRIHVMIYHSILDKAQLERQYQQGLLQSRYNHERL